MPQEESGTKLYVGNLNFKTTEETLQDVFAADGRVVLEITLIRDRDTNAPRGFGFVTMGSPADAQAAIDALNGEVLDGRPLTVNPAEERKSRSQGRSSYGGGGGGGGGGRGRGGFNPRGGGHRNGGGGSHGYDHTDPAEALFLSDALKNA